MRMKTFAPNSLKLLPAAHAAATDRAPDSLAAGTPPGLREDLAALLGDGKVLSRAIDLVRYASDASPYRYFPSVVVMAETVEDIAKTLAYAAGHGHAVCFRAGGTSLNGQSQSDGILIDVRRHWRGVTVEDEGRTARIRPGTTLGQANAVLARKGRVLGPDPASTGVATIGGVVANNASGMSCGVVHNSYRTVRSMTLLLASGTMVDTAAPGAEEHFAAAEPELTQGLLEIKAEIEADAELTARIRRKYEIKNTSGYRLDAFLDGATPLEIFRRLVIASEGTLAFIAEVVFDTLAIQRERATALLMFKTLETATAAVPDFVHAGATAVELIDENGLRMATALPGVPQQWKAMPKGFAGLLVEFRAADEAERDRVKERAEALTAGLDLLEPGAFTSDPARIGMFWMVREGLLPLAGSARPQGTALLIEDVCVPVDRVAEACHDILALLERHGFEPNVAGHASAGNLHMGLTPNLSQQAGRDAYAAFMGALADLIVTKYDGSLKAEHGTGRNMAPFLTKEWGEKATALMWQAKQLADPKGMLGPGVMLSRDPEAHVKNLHSWPAIETTSRADTCIECGFCEAVCPSRDVTTTPRQRIILRREMARQENGSPLQKALLEQYEYDGLETCAGDGSCSIACPLGIDTGVLMKHFRTQEHSPRAERIARAVARRWADAEKGARTAVRLGNLGRKVGGDRSLTALTGALRKIVSNDLMPNWLSCMPSAADPHLPATEREGAVAVYFPACINRIFGPPHTEHHLGSVPAAMVAVADRAGRPVWIPDDVVGACCATVWHSKGYAEGNELMANRIVDRLWKWSEEGRLPVVVDASSCTYGIVDEIQGYLTDTNTARHKALNVVDSLTFIRDELLPHLDVREKLASAVVHPTCSMRHLKDDSQLADVARALADDVTVPVAATCCGFAGDRGFLHPELTGGATMGEAAEVETRTYDAYLSANRICELGLEQATGHPYHHVVYELERLTRPTS